METFKTPHATVDHEPQWNKIEITVDNPENASLDIMDIKEIYAVFFRKWLHWRIDGMKPDDVINLGYHVGKQYP